MARARLGGRLGAHRLRPRIEPGRALRCAQGEQMIELADRRIDTVGAPALPKIDVRAVNFHYGKTHALKNVDLSVPANAVTAIIGPSGCGKSTLLRTINRIYELYPGQHATGEIA